MVTKIVKIKNNESRAEPNLQETDRTSMHLTFVLILFYSLLLWPQLCMPALQNNSQLYFLLFLSLLLLSAATCASYNFSFLSPQGLNFSSSQSSAPFWSGTLFLSCLAPIVFLPPTASNFIINLNLMTSSLWCSFL